MKKLFVICLALLCIGLFISPVSAEEHANSGTGKPTDGWTLHVDAKKHVPHMPDMVVHHYCKPVSGGLTECQLYDSDKPDARLIGVEVIVDAATYKKFSKKEKKQWHYHKMEIPKVDAKLPDLSEEEAAKVLKGMEDTYGKVYILWGQGKTDLPIGKPTVSILH
jgi:hypothetical protein